MQRAYAGIEEDLNREPMRLGRDCRDM